ncbi:MAG: HD domain-containing protein, partial [Candidatus Omnitrophica bacterium]|nr:HD domain-containing protein [Candidatus Omnitrophota bacterium]MCA9425682.1 HD domain-containing protein [Candidatus Omnitrophota bacterium]
QIVVRAWQHAQRVVTERTGEDLSAKPPRVALIAIGGYGRAHLHPQSDVDLLFLHKSSLTHVETEIIKLTLQTLWDTTLEIGHAARTYNDCLRAALEDSDTRTALLENRLLAGNRQIFDHFHRNYRNWLVRRGTQQFIRQKERERQIRYHRYGDTVLLQEPNLKEGPGGLRDLHHGLWLAIAMHGIPSLAGIRRRGLIREPFYSELQAAVDFLLRIRNELHVTLKTPSNKLSFEVQERIAKAFGYRDEGVNLAEESLMRDYYSAAYRVQQFADRMTNRCLKPTPLKRLKEKFQAKKLGDGFILQGGKLRVKNPETFFINHPNRIIQILEIFQKTACSMDGDLLTELNQHLSTTRPSEFSSSKEIGETLIGLMSKKGRVGPLFRIFYETWFLDAFIPEFKVIRFLPRRDLYHRYTVDEHSLITTEILDGLAESQAPESPCLRREEIEARFPAAYRKWRWWGKKSTKAFGKGEDPHGELDDTLTLPIYSAESEKIIREIKELFAKIEKPALLYLATFLHDIGKGRGGDHHVKGAEIACEVCRRLHMNVPDTDLVIFLVEKHLEFAKIAFRFDTQDFKTIEDFASWCNTVEKLDYLYLLTLADIWAVNTDLLTEWKLTMLHQFYRSVRSVIEDRVSAELNMERQRRETVTQLLATLPRDLSESDAERFISRMPSNYVDQMDPSQIHFHLRLLRKYTREKPIVGCNQSMMNIIEVVTIQPSRIGNFMRTARALSSLDLSIADARIFIRDDGDAINTLHVMHQEGVSLRQEIKDKIIERTVASLQDEWNEVWNPKKLKAQEIGRFRFEPMVEVYNKVSPQFTVIEVRCADSVGLLVKITSVLAKYGLDIRFARIHTEEQRVFDTFYVLDENRRKFEDHQKINWLKASIVKAIEAES